MKKQHVRAHTSHGTRSRKPVQTAEQKRKTLTSADVKLTYTRERSQSKHSLSQGNVPRWSNKKRDSLTVNFQTDFEQNSKHDRPAFNAIQRKKNIYTNKPGSNHSERRDSVIRTQSITSSQSIPEVSIDQPQIEVTSSNRTAADDNIFITQCNEREKKQKEAWSGERRNETSILCLSVDSASDDNSSEYDTDIEDSFPEPECAPYDPSATDIYVQECKDIGFVPISFIMKKFRNKTLEMRHHGLGVNGTLAMTKALLNNTCITQLDLSENQLKTEGGLAFAAMLHENNYISDLVLCDNELLPEAGIAFAKMLLVNTTLKYLNLKGNRFTDRVAKAFAESLKINNSLQELNLSYNEIGEQGGLYLGAGLALNKSLKSFNLKWNCIRAKGAVSVAAALRKNSCLTDLNLSWNGISFIGCLAFGRHLKVNKALKSLDISNNRIGVYGASKIAPGLAAHPCLHTFKIGLNPIGDEGVMYVLEAVFKNTSIELLGLDDITVSHDTYKMICSLENTRDITIVTGGLGGYSKGKPPPSGMDVLVQFIQDNRMRLTDLFFQWDKDKSGDISKEEFLRGLLETGLKMDKFQLVNLIDQIDKNNDGLIDFSEITAGRKLVVSERRFQKKVAIRTEEREAESIRLPKIKGF